MQAEKIFRAALVAVNPEKAVAAECAGIRDRYRMGGFQRLMVIGFGKAAYPMALAVEGGLGELVDSGVIVTTYGSASPDGLIKIRAMEAGHPVPDAHGVQAAGQIIGLARQADERTLVVLLISGGGSALLVAPVPAISLGDKQRITRMLLNCGADIGELNTVRKHLSMVKGGRLAEMLQPASTTALILSDVLGDRLDVIASGPISPDTSSFEDAVAVLRKYALLDCAPEPVMQHLRSGILGHAAETPKPGARAFSTVDCRVVGNLARAIESAAAAAKREGFTVEVISAGITGEARNAGIMLAEKALQAKLRPGRTSPVCLLSGGETTVTVTGSGKGGRNMEVALAFARSIDSVPGITLLSAGTDGEDGQTGAAGAYADGFTVQRVLAKGIDPAAALADNDTCTLFTVEGGIFVTGPTGTNVNDLQIILVT